MLISAASAQVELIALGHIVLLNCFSPSFSKEIKCFWDNLRGDRAHLLSFPYLLPSLKMTVTANCCPEKFGHLLFYIPRFLSLKINKTKGEGKTEYRKEFEPSEHLDEIFWWNTFDSFFFSSLIVHRSLLLRSASTLFLFFTAVFFSLLFFSLFSLLFFPLGHPYSGEISLSGALSS